MFGIEDLTEETIKDITKNGGKINLSFKGTDIIAEIKLESELVKYLKGRLELNKNDSRARHEDLCILDILKREKC